MSVNSPKQAIQQLLIRLGVYERLRVSWLYDAYFSVVDPSVIAERTREIDFYRQTLQGFQKGSLVFDVGANQGYKTFMFLSLGARVVALDPDTANQEKLRQRYLRFRLTPKPVQVVGKAVSDRAAVATMFVDAPGSAKNTMSSKWVETLREDTKRFGEHLEFGGTRSVETTTLDDLIALYGKPFFIKIDVEGHERSVLAGLTQPVPYVSFEVNLPEFVEEGRDCLRLLNEIAANGQFNYTSDNVSGLRLDRWVSYSEFVSIFNAIATKSIDVYWRTPPTP